MYEPVALDSRRLGLPPTCKEDEGLAQHRLVYNAVRKLNRKGLAFPVEVGTSGSHGRHPHVRAAWRVHASESERLSNMAKRDEAIAKVNLNPLS